MSGISSRLLLLASTAAPAGGARGGFGGGRRRRIRSRSRSRGERSRSRTRTRSRSRRRSRSRSLQPCGRVEASPCPASTGQTGSPEAPETSWVSRYSPALPAGLVALCTSDLCGLCATQLSGPLQAQDHYAGARHARRVQGRLEEAFHEDPSQPLPQLVGATNTWEKEEKQGPALPTTEELAEAMEQPLTGLQEEVRNLWDPPLPMDVLVLIREEQCDICHVFLNNEVDMVAHYGGGPHQKAVQRLLASRSEGRLSEDEVLRCDLCGNIFPGPEAAAQHYAGKRHLKAVRTRGSFHCTTCDVACSSEGHLREHMRGRPHRLKAGESPHLSNKAVFVNNCDLCGVRCESKATFHEHLKGRQHASNAGRLEVGEGHFDCAACGVKCNSKTSLEEHRRGKVHAGNVPEEAREDPPQAPLPMEVLLLMGEEQCGVCHSTLLTPQESMAHYSGMSHGEKLERLMASREPPSKGELERCEVCNVSLANPDSATQHYAGKRHHKELRNLATGLGNCQLGCDACGVKCTSKASLEEHMRGSKHIANVQLHSVLTDFPR